jgi:hypothetical protein
MTTRTVEPEVVQTVREEARASSAEPAAAPVNSTLGKKIENHLIKAVIATVCCCMPFGIVAIVFAAQVDPKRYAGDLAGALEASKKASLWGNVAIGVGVLMNLIWVIFWNVLGFSALTETLMNTLVN